MKLGAALLALLFAALAVLVAGDGALVGLDRRANQALAGLGGPALVPLFQAISAMAGVVAASVLALVTSLAFWAKGLRRNVLAIWLTWAGTMATIVVIKPLVARPRPEPLAGFVETGLSFPSGSTTIAVGVYGVVALLLAQLCRGRTCRWTLYRLLFIFVALVGLSRLALGVHYLSDVVAGALAGGFWALVGMMVAGRHEGRVS